MKKPGAPATIEIVLFSAYIVFLVSVVFTFRAVSSLAIGLILFLGILSNRKAVDRSNIRKNLLLFLLSCSLLFLLECFSSVYTNNASEQWTLLQRSSGLVFVPLAVLSSSHLLTPKTFQKILGSFTLIILIGSLYCLLLTTVRYLKGAPASIFFYHDLVKPLSQHAIQYSIFTFIALVWLLENPVLKSNLYPLWLSRLVIPFLSFFLVLLSSKLIITFYILYLFYFFLVIHPYRGRRWPVYIVFLTITTLLVTTKNPVGDRFRAVLAGNSMLFEQKTFNPGIYFNGLQFRLLEWRFTGNILSEQQAWVRGLTPGDAQSYLDKKYMDENMYTGVPGTQKRGFLGYHTHNQFLQSLLENGLPALLIFILICYSLLLMAKQSKSRAFNWLVSLLVIYCFTDAPFKTQYGIVMFTFFPALIFMATKTEEATSFLPLGRTSFAMSPKQPH